MLPLIKQLLYKCGLKLRKPIEIGSRERVFLSVSKLFCILYFTQHLWHPLDTSNPKLDTWLTNIEQTEDDRCQFSIFDHIFVSGKSLWCQMRDKKLEQIVRIFLSSGRESELMSSSIISSYSFMSLCWLESESVLMSLNRICFERAFQRFSESDTPRLKDRL